MINVVILNFINIHSVLKLSHELDKPAELHDGGGDGDVLLVQGHEDVGVKWMTFSRDYSINLLRGLEAASTFA